MVIAGFAGALANRVSSFETNITSSHGTWDSPDSPTSIARLTDKNEKLAEVVDDYLNQNGDFNASIAIGDEDVSLAYNEEGSFETASIVKIEILIRWLLINQDDIDLDAHEYELARSMIQNSDNDATTELCSLISHETQIGDVPGGTDPCVEYGLWGQAETTASDQLRVLKAATEPGLLSTRDIAITREFMSGIAPDQAWGVSAVAADDYSTNHVWLKNGWDYRDDNWLVHSVGVYDAQGSSPIRIAVLTSGHVDFESGKHHVEQLSLLAMDVLRGH